MLRGWRGGGLAWTQVPRGGRQTSLLSKEIRMGALASVRRFVETLPGKIVLCASVMAASLGAVVAAGVVADTAGSAPALAAVQTEQSFASSFADSDDDDDDDDEVAEHEEEEEAESDDDSVAVVESDDDSDRGRRRRGRVRRQRCGLR